MWRRLQPWFDPRLHTATSEIHGNGLFTRARFAAGEVVMRWGGLVVPRALYAPDRFRSQATTDYDDDHHLTESIDAPPTIDDTLNHSCDPNLWMIDAVTCVARRWIPADQELLIDAAVYLDSEDYIHADPCRCGTPLCRGVIRGDDWRRPELQLRYAGHFATFLEARIQRLAAGAAREAG